MAIPTTRAEFKLNCLRRLGHPVIQINLDDSQIEDRIDEALSFFADFHFDGSEKMYYKHQVTTQNKTDKYITMPDNIIGVVRLFDIGFTNSSTSLFDMRYQLMVNELFQLGNTNMAPYYFAMTHIELINEIVNGKVPIRYQRHNNRLYCDMDWNKVETGQFLLVEAYNVIDPDDFADVWKDKWLQRYATALIKRNWGEIMSKYAGMPNVGGMTFNGQQKLLEANQEIQQLEYDLINTYSAPSMGIMG